MLNYKAAYRFQQGVFFAEVLDFPEASAFGQTLGQARDNLISALKFAVERVLRRGELLPLPDPRKTSADAYLLETLTVVPDEGDRIMVRQG